MNPCFRNLVKMEFVVTNACTGRCKHCSEGEHTACGTHIDTEMAVRAIESVSSVYDIQTVMVFGGEPLLYPEVVYPILAQATALNVPRRQLITNGYFSKDHATISEVARRLSECGLNDLLVSVDAFHQETIPLDVVRLFLAEAKRFGIPTRLQPAWLVSTTDENPYNQKTRAILESLGDLALPVSEGNVVFPEGNALVYLAEYFSENLPENPYRDDPYDIRCLSFSPDGEVLGANACEVDILSIIDSYMPKGETR